MHGKILAFIMAVFLIAPALSAAEERYLCAAEKSTGFKYSSNTKNWESVNFNVNQDKFVITNSKLKDSKLEITMIGEKDPICHSRNGFNIYGNAYFKCIGGEFKFDKKTGRYLRSNNFGYIHGDEDNSTPYIEIGKCSPF
jgi:hypothetical protein